MDSWIQYAILISVGFVVGFINTVAGGASLLSLQENKTVKTINTKIFFILPNLI